MSIDVVLPVESDSEVRIELRSLLTELEPIDVSGWPIKGGRHRGMLDAFSGQRPQVVPEPPP